MFETVFQKWWRENKEMVCFDITHNQGISLLNPVQEARLMHIAAQAWVAAQDGISVELLEEVA